MGIWKNPNEVPTKSHLVICHGFLDKTTEIISFHWDNNSSWQSFVDQFRIIKWCYYDELCNTF
jgi:hypothetical protein